MNINTHQYAKIEFELTDGDKAILNEASEVGYYVFVNNSGFFLLINDFEAFETLGLSEALLSVISMIYETNCLAILIN